VKIDLQIFHKGKCCQKPYCNADSLFHVGKEFVVVKTRALEAVGLMSPSYNSKIIALSINKKT